MKTMLLPNVQATTSGAISLTNATVIETQGEVIATGGGSAITGAVGKDMPECMPAWDTATHITKARWKQICARTLTEPHI
jgi:hypothetical protein